VTLLRPLRRPRSADEQVLRRTALRIGSQIAAAVVITVVGLAAVAVVLVLQNQHRADDVLMNTAITRVDVSDPPAGTWVVVRRDGGSQITTPGRAPSAIRTPISFVRRATTNAITP